MWWGKQDGNGNVPWILSRLQPPEPATGPLQQHRGTPTERCASKIRQDEGLLLLPVLQEEWSAQNWCPLSVYHRVCTTEPGTGSPCPYRKTDVQSCLAPASHNTPSSCLMGSVSDPRDHLTAPPSHLHSHVCLTLPVGYSASTGLETARMLPCMSWEGHHVSLAGASVPHMAASLISAQ